MWHQAEGATCIKAQKSTLPPAGFETSVVCSPGPPCGFPCPHPQPSPQALTSEDPPAPPAAGDLGLFGKCTEAGHGGGLEACPRSPENHCPCPLLPSQPNPGPTPASPGGHLLSPGAILQRELAQRREELT